MPCVKRHLKIGYRSKESRGGEEGKEGWSNKTEHKAQVIVCAKSNRKYQRQLYTCAHQIYIYIFVGLNVF